MAMGQRQSTEVATALMRLIASFDHAGVRVDIATDNIRFVGSKRGVTDALRTFSKRCDAVGVVLNELPRNATEEQIAAQVVTRADFLGEIIDYTRKTVTCRQKIIDRLNELWGLRSSWTNRQQIGHTAVMMWCSGPLRVPLVRRYASLAFLRQQGKLLFDHPDAWDAPANVPSDVMDDLHQWHVLVSGNAETPIQEPGAPDDLFIFTDASAWGWAAVAMAASSDGVQIAQMPWGQTLPGAEQSTTAEPEAIWRAICRFVRPSDAVNVCVFSDHDPFVTAINRGHSAAAGNNGVLARIATRFPALNLRAQFIKGADNPADELSRQRATADATDRAARGVRDILGSVRPGRQDAAGPMTTTAGSPITDIRAAGGAMRAKRCEADKCSQLRV